MSSSRLAGAVSRRVPAATAVRQATVVELLSPATDEAAQTDTGWRVRLDLGGGEVLNAGVAGSYEPVPGDRVAVAFYLGKAFVLDRITAGGGQPPGRLVANGRAVGNPYATQTGTTEIAVASLTLPAVPLRTGCAYEVLLRTGYSTATANQYVFVRLRQGSAAGADLGEFFRLPTTVAAQVCGAFSRIVIGNSTGVDLVLDLVPTLSGPPSVVANLYGNATSPAYIEVNRLGPVQRYSYAAPVSLPPDL